MQQNAVIDLDIKKTKLESEVISDLSVPTGYIPISLSVAGKLGVPKTIHCRNFSTSELIDISLFDDKYLTKRVISILNNVILEKTDVGMWPDKAIIELLVNLYANFFSVNIEDVTFPVTEEDLEWLRDHEMEERAKDLESGKWVPKITLPLTSFKTKELKSEVKAFLTFKKKDFSAKFNAYPRFGDVLLLESMVEGRFAEEEKKFEPLRKRLALRDKMLSMGNEPIDEPTDKEYLTLQLHEVEKIRYLTLASMAIYLVEYNGVSTKELPFEEKVKIVSSPMFDVTLGKQLTKKFEELDFGIDPEVEVINPITKEPCTRKFTFQVLALLQAIQASDANGYDISYDD